MATFARVAIMDLQLSHIAALILESDTQMAVKFGMTHLLNAFDYVNMSATVLDIIGM